MGPQRAELIKKELGLHTFRDMLEYFPFRYADRSEFIKINQVQPQLEWVQLYGVIKTMQEEGSGRASRLVATFADDTDSIELVWFQGVSYLKKSLQINTPFVVYGKVSWFQNRAQISHPEMEPANAQSFAGGLQPFYSTTEKLRARGITNKSFSKITQSLFEKLDVNKLPEILPPIFLQQYQLMSRNRALYAIHFPANQQEASAALHRMKWEELFITQLKIGQLRVQHHAQAGYLFPKVGGHFNEFYQKHLPFELTDAQKRVIKEIRQDTVTGKQMNRLLQGDVGSGKTIVAMLAMLLAVDNGFQACLMAPTEILARQHYESLLPLFESVQVNVALLTGSIKTKERQPILNGFADGSIHIAIGTHALLEDKVMFKNLGMALIDEQHRFGVGQRARLWQKNELAPHVLVMTATPIPRTLAMTIWGDLEVSVIDQLPPGRKPITTVKRADSHRAHILDFIRTEIDKGRQAYIVYPLIEESEKADCESLQEGYFQIKTFFPEHKYNIGIVHGRQPADERERNMQRFVKGEAHVLVATTVIEVGVNVPNASVMLIESAERFGLSQLHQLRGRVGRGAEQSYCILLHGQKLSDDTRKRLNIMVGTQDGFVIAEEDLKLRGPGDIYGTKQSGELKFKVANIVEDLGILQQAREAAVLLLQHDPELKNYPALRHAIHTTSGTIAWKKVS